MSPALVALTLLASLLSPATAHANSVTANEPVFTHYKNPGGLVFIVALCSISAGIDAQTTVSHCQVNGIDNVYLPNDAHPLVRVDEMSMMGSRSASMWVGSVPVPASICSGGYAWFRTSGNVYAEPRCRHVS